MAVTILALLASATLAHAGPSADPVTLNAPREGATYRLGEPLRGIGPSPYTNAKKYDCTITQGAVRWHRESATPGFEMPVADVNKFKPGPAVITVRVFYKKAWLPSAKASFTFTPSKTAKQVAGAAAKYDKEVVAKAIAEARGKWKTICGCDVAMRVDESSLSADGPQGGNLTSKIADTFGIVGFSAEPEVCKDDASKKKLCEHVRAVVVAEERGDGMGGQCSSDDKHVVTCTVGQGYGGDVLRGIGMTRGSAGYQW